MDPESIKTIFKIVDWGGNIYSFIKSEFGDDGSASVELDYVSRLIGRVGPETEDDKQKRLEHFSKQDSTSLIRKVLAPFRESRRILSTKISNRRMKNANQHIMPESSGGAPIIGLIDTSKLFSGKKGVVLTPTHCYARSKKTKYQFELKSLRAAYGTPRVVILVAGDEVIRLPCGNMGEILFSVFYELLLPPESEKDAELRKKAQSEKDFAAIIRSTLESQSSSGIILKGLNETQSLNLKKEILPDHVQLNQVIATIDYDAENPVCYDAISFTKAGFHFKSLGQKKSYKFKDLIGIVGFSFDQKNLMLRIDGIGGFVSVPCYANGILIESIFEKLSPVKLGPATLSVKTVPAKNFAEIIQETLKKHKSRKVRAGKIRRSVRKSVRRFVVPEEASNDEIIGVIDLTVFGSRKKAFVFTPTHVHAKTKDESFSFRHDRLIYARLDGSVKVTIRGVGEISLYCERRTEAIMEVLNAICS